MSAYEQEPIASVTQLQKLRTAAETYESFYQLNGLTELQRKGFSTVLNRVLHIDETEDRSTHFVIAKADDAPRRIREHYNRLGVPAHHIQYNAKDIIVASTDGNLITKYDVVSAHGTYRANLGHGNDNYDPYHETLELSLVADSAKLSIKNLIRAEFNVATGNGTVEFGGQPRGWILSDRESVRIRDIILTPALPDSEPVAALGHIATAS
jgi:hypothetical protein